MVFLITESVQFQDIMVPLSREYEMPAQEFDNCGEAVTLGRGVGVLGVHPRDLQQLQWYVPSPNTCAPRGAQEKTPKAFQQCRPCPRLCSCAPARSLLRAARNEILWSSYLSFIHWNNQWNCFFLVFSFFFLILAYLISALLSFVALVMC